jgi:hypothetical protein
MPPSENVVKLSELHIEELQQMPFQYTPLSHHILGEPPRSSPVRIFDPTEM